MKGYKSSIALVEADCSKYKFYYREQSLFNEEGEKVFDSKRSWKYHVTPGSIGETLYDTLCK